MITEATQSIREFDELRCQVAERCVVIAERTLSRREEPLTSWKP